MENCNNESTSSASTSTIHRFTFKKRICVFCALPLDLKETQVESTNWNSLNEDTFIKGISILCDALNLKGNFNELFGNDDGLANWRLLGIDNFVRCICCETCYQLISELVSLQQLIVKSQISIKENARKLENIVVVSSLGHHQQTDDFDSPSSLEYSIGECVQLRQKILNNFNKNYPESQPKDVLSRKSKYFLCQKQAVVLLKRLKVSPSTGNQDITRSPIKEISDEEYTSPCPNSPETMETYEDADEKDKKEDQEYRPIKRGRRRATGRKRGRPRIIKPPKTSRKPGRPRKIKQDPPPPSSSKVVPKIKRNTKPAIILVEAETSQLNMNIDELAPSPEKPATVSSTKGGHPILIGSRRYYRSLHEGSGPKQHAIYFLSTSPSPNGNDMETNLMIYNVKLCKTSTSLRCLHPDCPYQETLTGYFTDQTILRNMRFHIRFAHRSLPKKDKPEENKPSFYYCHFCESQMDSMMSLLEHRRQLHTEDDHDQLPPFCFCDVCGDPNVAVEDLVQHVISHKSELEKEDMLKKGARKEKGFLKPLIHPCDQCDKCFKCHTELMTHRNTHLPPELKFKFVCEICGKGFQKRSVVEHHKRRVHLKEVPLVLKCHVCGKGFMQCQKVRWEEHLNRHTGEKPYQCEECGKRFIGKWPLTKHVRAMHVGGKEKVSCEFCGKIYKTEAYLKKHCLKNHRDKFKLKRGTLGDEDNEKYKNLEHRDDFIGPKLRYPCEPCGKVFVFKSMLITHLKNRHKIFYERKEDYPWQMTLEDVSAIEAAAT